jgi:hypothetical protein
MNMVRRRLARIAGNYGGQQPLSGYVGALGVFGASIAVGVAATYGTRRRPPRLSLGDVLLTAIATHKLSRLIAKDAVTSPLRAPFTTFDGPAGAGEVNESVTAHGAGHAVGELITCPFCLSVWTSTALCAGWVFTPALTRLLTAGLTAVAGADFLQLAYDAAKKASGNAAG